eukprot:2541747-Rhodomonas_salina.1
MVHIKDNTTLSNVVAQWENGLACTTVASLHLHTQAVCSYTVARPCPVLTSMPLRWYQAGCHVSR